jgi:S-DNA-T family DNA segregation ATPase FtsK/SpoIIIE
MPEAIPLSQVIQESEFFSLFNGQEWIKGRGERNIVPTGLLDNPSRCQQCPFSINFNESGGSFWIVGSPGSGKSLTLMTIATSLAMTHSPETAQIYVLEFGTGALSCLEAFPHTGAVIKPNESERIDRLFSFLGEEIKNRTEIDWRNGGLPDIYLFINNIDDFRQQYPDQSDELGRFIRFGGSVGIHVIISSNRGSELPRTLGGNIPSRIVLQLAEKQDYTDVLSTIVPPLSLKTECRGFYLSDQMAECQIAYPNLALISPKNHVQSATINQQGNEKDLQEV